MKNIIAALAITVSAFLALPAMAQDAGLYDPVAPEGSAFVRFINAGASAEKPSINGKTYQEVDRGGISAYFPLKAGKLEAAMGAMKVDDKVESGAFYTAVLNDGKMSVLKDAPIGNAAKAMIVFYNLSDKPAALKTANGKVGIIANIEPGQNGSREINALPVSLAVFEDGTNVAAIDSVDLKRNESTAIILDKTPDGKFTATKTQATTDTKQ